MRPHRNAPYQATPHPMLAVAAATASLPVRALKAAVDWFLAEIVAWLVGIPGFVALHVRRHHHEAYLRAQQRVQVEQARILARTLQAATAAIQAHFEAILTAIERLDRKHARFDPHFRGSLEAELLSFDQALLRLREAATEPLVRDAIADYLVATLAVRDEPRSDPHP